MRTTKKPGSVEFISTHAITAAENYIQIYYRALEADRSEIASFYVPATALPDGKTIPTITYCGNVVTSAQVLQTQFEKEMPPMHFDVQSLDCQIINSNSPSGVHSVASGKNISILGLASGNVQVGPRKESELRGFSETFILVPNPETTGQKTRGKGQKEWLIQSSNFRFVV